MTYPPDRAMRTLGALSLADRDRFVEFVADPDSGRMWVEIGEGDNPVDAWLSGVGVWEVFPDEVDDLLAREWVHVTDDGGRIDVTDKGVYWLGRWTKARRHTGG